MSVCGKLRLVALSIVILLGAVSAVKADVVTFAPLGGANLSPYAGHAEGGWTVTPTAGNWFEAHIFGNPIPSILAGPIFNPSTSAIQLTGAGAFTFSSVDMVSQNGSGSSYLFQGFLGATQVYSTGGLIGAGAVFNTFNNPFSALVVDRILITITPTQGTSSMNVDNITIFRSVSEVPEPATLLLLGSGLVGITAKLRKRRTNV